MVRAAKSVLRSAAAAAAFFSVILFSAACAPKLDENTAAWSDAVLSCSDENGIRLVRNRETRIGDLCADAFRSAGDAEIGIINGGGIRDDLPKGAVTVEDIQSVLEFGNHLCVAKVSGQTILDALEFGSRYTKEYTSRGVAKSEHNSHTEEGEFAGFLQVSGLKYTIDPSVRATVTTKDDAFTGVRAERRVKDVSVLNSAGKYEPLDPERIYSVAGPDYLLDLQGDGYAMFADCERTVSEAVTDQSLLETYLREKLKGRIRTKKIETGRITVLGQEETK